MGLAQEENLALLGEAIGMNLERVAVEQYIGPYRADIIARDEQLEVIIENQLRPTDHKHLGQLLVYAANRGSRAIVWIASQVTDEYRKVIDWLNDKTDVKFYALEVELWRIGSKGSPVAPKFNIVCQPNELADQIRNPGGEPGEAQQLQLEFWTGLLELMGERELPFNIPRPRAQQWCDLRIGTSRAHIGLTASRNGRMSCQLYMGSSQAGVVFEKLEGERATIEAELGSAGQLEWQPLPERTACRIALYNDIGTLEDRGEWPQVYEWMLEWAQKFDAVFAQRVKNMVLPEPSLVEAPATPAEPDAAAP